VVSLENNQAALRGLPSYVWRYGQERRLELIDRYAPLAGRRVLDVGCGIGTYVDKLRQCSDLVCGIDIEVERVMEGGRHQPNLLVAAAEWPPFLTGSFDVVLLHEVLEHVADDRQVVREAHRLLTEGGRMVIFAPNRLYPFETHGICWRGQYRFGNYPLVNYLPTPLRERLCPHARAYTTGGLRRLLSDLDHRVVVHTQIYPGYDNIVARHHGLGSSLRRATYFLERTPLRLFGLSHLLVVEKPTAIAPSTSVR
jgi:SAM-dependent methyltransferase